MEYYRTLLILTFLLLINSANAGFLDKIFGEENKKDNKKNDNEKKENENKPNSSDDGIEPNKPVSEEKGLNYLQEFGYVEPGQLSSKGMAAKMEDAVKSAVTKFQEFAGLPVTGALDVKTREKMAAKRCGMVDVQMLSSGRGSAYRWNKRQISYNIANFSPDLPTSQQREAVKRAYGEWARYVPLDFSESDSSNADIKIRFASGSHGDPWPFDGRGGVLAHATMPTSGMLHFDESENWVYMDGRKIASSRYTDLYPVAIHEIGHTLGLEHSRVQDSIMAPFYQETADENGRYIMPTLKSADIRAIQEIYGPRSGSSRGHSSSDDRGSDRWNSGGNRDRERDRFGSSFGSFFGSSGGRQGSSGSSHRGSGDSWGHTTDFLDKLLKKWGGMDWGRK